MTGRRRLVVANWKMYKGPGEAAALATAVAARIEGCRGGAGAPQVVLCPPSISLLEVCNALRDSDIQVGSQNSHWEMEGAFTGEISPPMILTAGGTHTILGHSERRQFFAESDAMVNLRLRAAVAAGLAPIVCCGESLEQRESGDFAGFILGQIDAALEGIKGDAVPGLTLAYEPIWAIGTGVTASVSQAQEVHRLIRIALAERIGDAAAHVRILYGGSVKPENAGALFAQEDIDGGLVGGASLDPDSFAAIVAAGG